MKLSSKKIYLIRHGQTDYNLKSIVQGCGVDSSLNAFGVEQAQAFHNAYRHTPFDKIYTSSLRRSIESVEPFVRDGVKSEPLSGLNEICWGRKEGQRITPEENIYYHQLLEEWRKGNTSLRIEGGESPEDVLERVKPAIDLILSRPEESTVLVCMHGRAIRILLCHLLNYPLRYMDYFEHQNLCLYLLLETTNGFRLDLFNNTKHLNDLVQKQAAAVS